MTTGVAELIERLTHMADNHHAIKDCYAMTKAADLLSRQEMEIKRLRNALAPFARIRADDGDDFRNYPGEAVIRCEVTAGEIKCARQALAEPQL